MEMKLLSAAAIRRCIIADPGQVIISADFDQMQMRIAAALAGETAMIEAAKKGESLHLTAANRLFGLDHTPDQSKLSKNINFTWLFAGGAKTMADRYSISVGEAIDLIKDYEKAFPRLAEFKRRVTQDIIRQALSPTEFKIFRQLRSRMYNYRSDTPQGRSARRAIQVELDRLCYRKIGWVETPYGRRIPVDISKAYAAINYLIQSLERDLFGEALLRVMDDGECNPCVLLPVHDELLGQAPRDDAEYYAARFAEIMTHEFMGVPMTAAGQVYGKSWGHGYLKNKERK